MTDLDELEPEITLIISPVTITPKREDLASRFSGNIPILLKITSLANVFTATVPTVGDALAALDDVCSDLAEVLRQISDISAELANKDRISMTDVQEVGVVHIQLRRSTDAPLQILRDYDSTILQELELDQTRSLVYRELKKIGQSRKEAAKVALGKKSSFLSVPLVLNVNISSDSTEMLLLLIWRHLQYYSEPKNMNTPPAKSSIANAMRLLATTDPNTFRTEVGTKLQPVLNRLSGLELVSPFRYLSFFLAAHRPSTLLQTAASSAKEWQESQGYVQIMCRRLRDSAGPLEDHESSNDHLDEKY